MVCALAMLRASVLRCRARSDPSARAWIRARSAWAYQTSRGSMPAKVRIDRRYAATVASTESAPHLRRVAVGPPGDLDAGRQPLDVPLPGAGHGLVEVVDVEDEMPLRGGEEPRSSTGGRLRRAARSGPTAASLPGRSPWAAPRHGRRRTPTTPCARSGSAAAPGRACRPGPAGGSAGPLRCCPAANSAWLARGTSARAALPRAIRCSLVGRVGAAGSCPRLGRAGPGSVFVIDVPSPRGGHARPGERRASATAPPRHRGRAATLVKPPVGGILRTG